MPISDKIILGTVQLGQEYGINNQSGKPSPQEAFDILTNAYSQKIRALDSSFSYGEAHRIIAEFHQSNSDKRFRIITKISPEQIAKGDIEDCIEKLLRDLGIDQLEALLFHSPQYLNHTAPPIGFLNMKTQGLIKNLGISIYTNPEFQTAIDSDLIDLIQIPYNLLDNNNKRGELLKQAKNSNKTIIARSVFLQGLFFKDLNNLPHKLNPLKYYLGMIQQIMNQKQLSIRELALGYVVNNTLIDHIVIGVETISQLVENVGVFKNLQKLESSITNQIDHINVAEEELLNPVNW